jgi:hypothetical protein
MGPTATVSQGQAGHTDNLAFRKGGADEREGIIVGSDPRQRDDHPAVAHVEI